MLTSNLLCLLSAHYFSQIYAGFWLVTGFIKAHCIQFAIPVAAAAASCINLLPRGCMCICTRVRVICLRVHVWYVLRALPHIIICLCEIYYARTNAYYSHTMLSVHKSLLCRKICWHIRRMPSHLNSGWNWVIGGWRPGGKVLYVNYKRLVHLWTPPYI